jgi:hypothetical protein
MFGSGQVSLGRFQRTFRNRRPGELRRFEFYNREVSASTPLQQKKSEATPGRDSPPVLET